jgi:hypothetical protein
MKQLLLGIIAVMGLATETKAVESAGYFRAWQGFAKPGLTSEQFLAELPSFMKETVELYRERALNNYIVVLPPQNKPAYIPDELALVALNSKENYDAIRATPEGQAYSARHWDVFNKENSKSATPVDYGATKPSALEHNQAYDMVGAPINWARGVTYVFIGTKKAGLSSKYFLQELQKHVELAKEVMAPKGLLGYIVISNELYEIAYINWESKEAHDSAGQSESGQGVFADAKRIMDVLMYQEAVPFAAGAPVELNKAYSTINE